MCICGEVFIVLYCIYNNKEREDYYMSEDLRGVFFIVKGQYRKGVEPSFTNKVTNDVSWLGGYNPSEDTTEDWYMCLDKYTFQCVGCGGNLKKVLRSVYTQIKKHKDLKHYLHYVSRYTSDDTYEVKYLGHSPLTHDQRAKKAEGRCPRVSPPMRCLYEAIYNEYGDYYEDLVKEQEDLAYSEIKDSTPFRKAKKLVKKTTPNNLVSTPTPKVQTKNENTGVKLKKIGAQRRGIKRLSAE